MSRYVGMWIYGGATARTLTTTPVILDDWVLAASGPGADADPDFGTVTIKVPGIYVSYCMLSFIGTTGDTYYVEFRVNGVVGAAFRGSVDGITSGTAQFSAMGGARLHEGDVVSVYVYSDNAGGSTFTLVDGQFGLFNA